MKALRPGVLLDTVKERGGAPAKLGCCPGFDGEGCGETINPGETLCRRHLRGLALVALDHRRWPRLRLSNGRVIRGDDAWRPWLRSAKGAELREVLSLLGMKEAFG